MKAGNSVEDESSRVPVFEERASGYASLPKNVFLLSAALLVMRSAETFYAPILPLYARVLDASIALFWVGVVTGIHRLGSVIMNPIAGPWCDRTGQRKPFIVGVLVASVASILGGLAFSVADLTLYRLLSGVGYGTLTIAALSYINSVTTIQNRATAMSLLSASTLAGAALGPFPGGYIAESFTPAILGYRMTFYSGGLIQLLVGIGAFFLIRQGMRSRRAMSEAGGKLSFSTIFRNRGVTITSGTALLFGVSHGAFMYFTIPLLGDSLGFSPSRIGWIISAFGFGHVIGALFMGPLSDKVGKRKPFVFMAVFGVGVLILVFSLLKSLPLMIATTFAIGLVTAPCCGIVPALVAELAPRLPATAMALQKASEQFGLFVGPMIGGILIPILGFSHAMVVYAAIAICGSFMFLSSVVERRLPAFEKV
jgi:MFS family permease